MNFTIPVPNCHTALVASVNMHYTMVSTRSCWHLNLLLWLSHFSKPGTTMATEITPALLLWKEHQYCKGILYDAIPKHLLSLVECVSLVPRLPLLGTSMLILCDCKVISTQSPAASLWHLYGLLITRPYVRTVRYTCTQTCLTKFTGLGAMLHICLRSLLVIMASNRTHT